MQLHSNSTISNFNIFSRWHFPQKHPLEFMHSSVCICSLFCLNVGSFGLFTIATGNQNDNHSNPFIIFRYFSERRKYMRYCLAYSTPLKTLSARWLSLFLPLLYTAQSTKRSANANSQNILHSLANSQLRIHIFIVNILFIFLYYKNKCHFRFYFLLFKFFNIK